MTARHVPRFYFSLRSPYSWLAYRDLLDRYPEPAGRLDWIPFWEPDEHSSRLLVEAGGEFVYSHMSRAKHLYVLQDVRRLAAVRELEFSWPVDRSPWWEVPHLAYLAARRAGRGPEFLEHAHRARWQEGRDICDPATVGRIGVAIGVDPGRLAGATEDPGIRQEGAEALLAIYRDGAFGVPFAVNGFQKFWGVDRLDAFVASLSDPGRSRPARPAQRVPEPVPAGLAPASVDDGHAGGCG